MIDLEPAARRMADVLSHVDKSQLGGPTPCPASTVGDVIDHVGMLTLAFTKAAEKDNEASGGGPPPAPDAANLEAGWLDRIVRDLDGLVVAWREPTAWEGITLAGGQEFPA